MKTLAHTLEHQPESCETVGSILARIGDKWTVLVVMVLAQKPHRFNDLKRTIRGISQRMLALTLRRLERDGLVRRTVTPSVPPRVDYQLTELGESLREPVQTLGDWAFRNVTAIERSRAVFDSVSGD